MKGLCCVKLVPRPKGELLGPCKYSPSSEMHAEQLENTEKESTVLYNFNVYNPGPASHLLPERGQRDQVRDFNLETSDFLARK